MSEHKYLTPEELSIIGSCRPTNPIAIAVHRINADLDALCAELKATREERQSALDARDEEIARLRVRAENAEALFANAANLDDCEEIRSRDRELDRMRTALKEIALISETVNPQPAQPGSEVTK